ncbi:hypothetical protein SeMB42_g05926 [Synchytrium endobioticum]|uniref:VWFA domain-containing protein n=1 Tax=Synchytrium endobioticum TaxID=286115 RepID=A0A507CLF0_9FUNG|nr:hypothetical protein SeLEV6574_g07213 [Synchytrium endobioticum]TPX40600.1 hypothetical protein SeMB42_g05926 [Synchytrium endobioticum]
MGLASKLKAQGASIANYGANPNPPAAGGPGPTNFQQQQYYGSSQATPPNAYGQQPGIYPSAPPANPYHPYPPSGPTNYPPYSSQQALYQQQQPSYPAGSAPPGPYAAAYAPPVPPKHPAQPPAAPPNQPYGTAAPPTQPNATPYGAYSQYDVRPGQVYPRPMGQYHQPFPQNPGVPPSQLPLPYAPPDTAALEQKLRRTIQENRLDSFYGTPQAFQTVLSKAQSVNFDAIAARWRIPRELAYDLVSLSLYDVIFFCDDSGSMAFEEHGERIDDLKEILGQVSSIATQFDADGIMVRFINSALEGNSIRSPLEVDSLLSQVNYHGGTMIGTNLDLKVLQPLVLRPAMTSTLAKPVLIITITDGEPNVEPRDKLTQVIKQAKAALNSQTRYGAGAVAFEFAQVGRDLKAQKFLESLDTHPDIGNMVDCTSYYELESEEYSRKGINLTPELWLLKLCCGAVDRSYDEQDEN